MKNVSRDYIDNVHIDRLLLEDKELYNIIKESSEESTKRIIFASITVIIELIKILSTYRLSEDLTSYRILDEKMTNIIQNITDDPSVRVYMLRANIITAINFGTSEIYYTDKFISKLKITENELIGTCLHEYGHYIGKHGIISSMSKRAIGIMIPIILREIIKEVPMVITFFIGKFISKIISPYIMILIDRPQEYFADSYATKKGYGKYLAAVLHKGEQYSRGIVCRDKTREECNMMMKSIRGLDSHPDVNKRISKLLKSTNTKSIVSSGRLELLIRFLERIRSFFRG